MAPQKRNSYSFEFKNEIKKDNDNPITNNMSNDETKEEEEAALAAALHAATAQPQVKEMLQCLYKDTRSGKPCPFESRSEVVLQMHERAEHIKKTGSRPTRMRSPSRTPRSPK